MQGALRVVVLAAVLGCGGARGTSPSSERVTAGVWRELTSEHFVVWTNTSPERARTLVQTMENLRQVVVGVSFFHKELRGKSFVVAFNDLDEVHQFVPPQFIAHAWSGHNVLLQPVIVLAASSLEHDRRIVTHELTHVIAFNVIAAQPDWFAEGLAGYFETVRLDESHATVDVGVPLENQFRYLHRAGLTPSAQLFACDSPACKDDRFYATTWALVTYLLNVHPALFTQYIARLIETPADQHPQLWSSVFAALPPATLDHELATWVHYGRINVMKYKITLRDWSVVEKPISEADALAAKGLLRYLFAPAAGASAEIARSLDLDSTNVLANMINAVSKKAMSHELAASITTAHPDDWRAWWLAWRAAESPSEALAAREKTCSLLDANPGAVPVEGCAREATGGFAEDPRRTIFNAAAAQFTPCFQKSKPAQLVPNMTIDVDIAESGAVTNARVSIGSPDTNACVEQILSGLRFPAHHPGPFHLSSSRPSATKTAP